jgi:response regulator RpfG family c-di-GMP phosphodiesterase
LSSVTSTSSNFTANNNNNPIILLIDDEKDILNLYQECLDNWGYQTISFSNPIDALNHIDKNISNCSLIITDYKMPEMNGIDFLKKIRQKHGLNIRLKLMLISAFMKTDFDLQDSINNLKIDKIIEKPIRLEHFKQEVDKLMMNQ